MFKSFDLIGEDQGLFTAIVLSVAFGLMIAFYISAENSKKTNVVQTPVVQIPVVKTQVKVQAQVPTLEDEILAIEQIGLGFITNKINENITGINIKTKLTKDGWKAGVTDGKNKINFNMEKVK